VREQLTPEQEADLRERLMVLAHEQWVHLMSYFLRHLSAENLVGWMELCEVPYDELLDHQKIIDRDWVTKTMRLLRKFWADMEDPQEEPAECSSWGRWACDDCNEYFWVRRDVAGGLVCPFCCCNVVHAIPFN
jgi:hypothetical protein